MKKTGMVSVVVLLMAAVGFTGAAPAPAAGAGKVVSDSWYKWNGGRGASGYFHIVRKETGDKAAPVLVAYEFVIKIGEKELSLAEEILCRDDATLTPLRIKSVGKGDDEFKTYTATIDWQKGEAGTTGTLNAEVEGRKQTMALPERTVDCFVLWEIVKGLPADKEKVFSFHFLESMELNLKRDHKISYVGEEEIGVGEKRVATRRFEQTSGGGRPIRYWVSAKGELVRVTMDETKEFLLSTEAVAKKGVGG